MGKHRNYYVIGLVVSLVYLAAAELIWLPAPLKTSAGMEWIEMIDWLLMLLALPPLLWAAGAALGIVALRKAYAGQSNRSRRNKLAYVLLYILKQAVIAVSLCVAGIALFDSEKLMLILLFIGISALLVVLDMLLSEMFDWDLIGKPRFPKRTVLLWMGIAIVLALLVSPTGYNVTYPGMTLNMNRYAHVENGTAGGTINGVLVFERPAVPMDWVYGKLFPQYRFEPIPEDEPPLTESYSQVVMMKTDANSVAAAIAMEKAGIGKGVTADGVRIVAIVSGSPVEGLLQAGDVIHRLNDRAVQSLDDMTGYMGDAIKPGDTVTLSIDREGETLRIDAPTRAADDDNNRTVFGISVQTNVKLDIPRSIDYKRYLAHIGGPSHGAMLTLAIIDQLTPGGVTGGLQVAGTGTIEPDGSVGLVGGIPQKAYAVSRTDADVFFVPAASAEDARAAAPALNIVPVRTIDEVLGWLAEHGSRLQGS
ncbi:PDZ domain-containing protein [Paenibacillus harenae]|uniref:PDZ domain-containing protein n=1 Tax=Paenibacillus harenae TaxID=306543 RepID=A0ABT9TWR4_PAEHA|nr:PDZ domain-containing protein [Paenibacillus harenae]MDQ0111810.1 PDZ domain-containing protein [Paenibacillus harenae]